MGMNEKFDFAMERRLRDLSPELHRRFTEAVFGLQNILTKYQKVFPNFTDHSELHSLSVIDFSNHIIGNQIGRLNADEIYTLLMACYFHDSGMGVSERDYEAFTPRIPFGDYFKTHSAANRPAVIRDFHNEYSGLFIVKYAELFDIPSEAHLKAIVQVARGHRKTNLLDEKEYPLSLPVPGGNTICLPYLAALIRLADEIDVLASRNPILLYDMESLTEEHDIIEFGKHQAIRALDITKDSFILLVDPSDPVIMEHIRRMVVKMQKTLDDCRRAVLYRTPYLITQKEIRLETL